MKKSLLIVMILLVALLRNTAAVTYGNPDSPDLVISLQNQDPSPAEPGKYVELKFLVENWGARNADNTTLEIIPQFPFTLEPGTSPSDNVGTIRGQSMAIDGAAVKFKLRVDDKAVDGDNKIDIRYKYHNADWITIKDYVVTVRSSDAIVSIVSAQTNPSQVAPGGTADARIVIRNMASSPMKNLKLKMDLTDSPLATLGGSNEQMISMLGAGENATFQFNLAAKPDAAAGLYRIPMLLNYQDRTGASYSRNSTVGMVVGSEPDLLVTTTDGALMPRTPGTVSVKIANKGLSDAKFLTAHLNEGQGYALISSADLYVGKVESDDYANADFKIYVTADKPGKLTLPLILEYRDSNNKLYSKQYDLSIMVYDDASLQKLGLRKASGSNGLLIVVIIVIAGLLVYRKFGRKAHKA